MSDSTMPNLITSEVAESIDQSVLCWLATVSGDGFPNVSPKEAFLHDGDGKILVANIASPVTVRNIEQNERVCLSFVNVFVQKGFKLAGIAIVLKPDDDGYEARRGMLTTLIGTRYPIISIIEITPVAVDEIIAPSYRLFPDSEPEDRIQEALATYRVEGYKKSLEQQRAVLPKNG